MRDAIFFFDLELGHRFVSAFDDEERVVTEAARSTRRARDGAFAAAFGHLRLEVRVRIDERNRAPKACGKKNFTAACELFEACDERGVVLRVGRALACESRGANAGRAAERVHFETRIICERERHRGLRDGHRFFCRVLFERRAVFDDDELVGSGADVFERSHVERKTFEQRAELVELAAVGRRDHEHVHDARRHAASLACYPRVMPKMVPVRFEPIGVVHSRLKEKRAAPRQGVVAHADGIIEIFKTTGMEHALEDLEGFDRIFVIFHFHGAKDFRPKVLPPRSSVRRGVLATRSPHRPNAIGLSVVRLFGVEGLVLRVGDIDMIDGTPVLDVKPYVPYADAFPNAHAGWLDDEAKKSREETPPDPIAPYEIRFEDDAARALAWLEAPGENLRTDNQRALALGPAPHAYRRIRKKGDAMEIAIKDFRATFTAHERTITVTRVYSGYSPKELATTAPELHKIFCDRD